MGTPATAVTALETLVREGHDVQAVVAQLDRPAGRGRKPTPPPTKLAAEDHGLPVLQPESLRHPEVLEELRALEPEVVVVVAYGKILPPEILALPAHGCVNLHFSLLPRWRGAAPVQRALEAGEARTGVTTMFMEEGLDTGPVLLREETEIGPLETAPELEKRLAREGSELLLRTLEGLTAGTLEPSPQDDRLATWAPAVTKEEGLVDWSLSMERIHDRWRAFQPWPGLFTWNGARRLLLERVHPRSAESEEPPGTVLGLEGEAVRVACGEGVLEIERVRPAGRKGMTGRAAFNGRHLSRGDRLGERREDGD